MQLIVYVFRFCRRILAFFKKWGPTLFLALVTLLPMWPLAASYCYSAFAIYAGSLFVMAISMSKKAMDHDNQTVPQKVLFGGQLENLNYMVVRMWIALASAFITVGLFMPDTLLATTVTANTVRGVALGSLAGWSIGHLDVLYKWLEARLEFLKAK